jgi:rhodanese-related sulfurtransferase
LTRKSIKQFIPLEEKNMFAKFYKLFALLIVASMILGACATTVQEPEVEVQLTEVVTAEAITPTEVPPTAVPPTEVPAPDMAAIFTEVIASLPADAGYGVIAAAALNEELADAAPFLLDVREVAEIEANGYIMGAVNVPIRQLLENLDKLPGLDEPIVVYCGSGHRGGIAVALLKGLGYTNVRNLGGGMGGWTKAGLAVETGLPAEAASISTPIVADQALFTAFNDFLTSMPDSFYMVTATALNESLAGGATPVMIDVRSQAEWDKDGYLEGATLIPLADFMTSLDQIPADLATPLLVYCGSGYRGAIVMTALRLMGYSDVTNLGGGLGAWKAASFPVAGWINWISTWTDFLVNIPAGFYTISAADLNTALVENPPFLLDVREASEIEASGFIPGAVNIPVREVLANLDKLPAQDQPIVVYCGSGHRGAMVMAALRFLGYTDVRNLGGGTGAWKKAELALETGVPAAPVAGTAPEVDATLLRDLNNFLANLPDGFFAVSAADLNTELAGGATPMMIDVRSPEDFAAGHIEGSVNFTINALLADLTMLPAKDAPVVVLCASGHRGALGMMAMRMMGWTDVRNLAGGIGGWTAAELPLVTP